jgi:hypothetical protein
MIDDGRGIRLRARQGGISTPQADHRQREQKPFRDIQPDGIRMQTLCCRAPEVGSPK